MASDARNREATRKSRFGRRLRRASFILPKTGERSKRQFTLRDASSRPSNKFDDDSRELLIGDGNGFDSFRRHMTRTEIFRDECKRRLRQAWTFANSTTGRGILKCSIGYVIGSLATLIPAISQFFGHKQDSKHMVATITVYFHPARSVGSMHEATMLALIAFCYAAFISFSSMAISLFFAHQDLIMLGHAIVLVVFVAGGFGFLAWVKQRMGNPLVNVAVSLAALGTISVLIREGSVQAGSFSFERVSQVLGMVIMGIIVASLVNVVLFPTLARKNLSHEMEQNTDLLGEMLITVTRAFLHGREQDLEDEYYKSLYKEHQSSLNTMKKLLNEAKRERYVLGEESIYTVEAKLVGCLSELSQDIGGLRSAALAEFAFINEQAQPVAMRSADEWMMSPPDTPGAEPEQYLRDLDVISELPESSAEQSVNEHANHSRIESKSSVSRLPQGSGGFYTTPSGTATPFSTYSAYSERTPQPPGGQADLAKTPGDMFVTFISQVGPPTKSLVYTLKQILDELPFREVVAGWNPWAARELEVAVSEQFHTSLKEAIELYREARTDALSSLYENRAVNAAVNAHDGQKSAAFARGQSSGTGSPFGTRGPQHQKTLFSTQPDEVLADIEEVSACCGHFSFALLDFAEGVLQYLAILDDLKAEMESRKRSWEWLLFWKNRSRVMSDVVSPVNTYHPEHSDEPETGYRIPSPIRKADRFGDLRRDRQSRPWYFGVYRAFRWFRRDDTRFAIKVGLGAALYALPAFLPQSRPFFLHWRGEWGLVSYMVVCSMTVGATNTSGFNRIYGTLIGAACAVVAWLIANHEGIANPWLLGFCGWIVSLGAFYINIAKQDGPMARFILLTYNLSALYSYSLSIHDDDNDDDEGGIDPAIWKIVLHRIVSVVVGTIWAIIVCRLIAPISARNKLRDGLSVLWLRMGLIWKRDPLALFLLGEPSSAYMDIREEADLQGFLGNLRSLRKAANSEFEFQGPFPDKSISKMLDLAGRMLDAFHAMNVVISKDPKCTPGEAAVLRYTRPERFALSARISHLFSVLASSIKLEYPLNDVLPSIDSSRDRLLAKISEYRRTGEGRELTTEQDFELIYAYVLVTGQLARDIEAVGSEIENLYGVLNEENLKLH